jgi:hypothetical protein
MRDNISPAKLPKYASPVNQHRKQMVWQVWVPLGVTLAIVLALAVLSIVGAVQGSPQVNHWGNISAILVILPVLFFGLIFMAIFGGGAYGLSKLLKKMPGWMLKVQLVMIQVAHTTRRAADTATKPVLAVNTFTTSVGTLWEKIFGKKQVR